MLTARLLPVIGVSAATLLGAACGDDGPDDPAEALADRVSAILDDDGSAVLARLAQGDVGVGAAQLADAEVRCPRVLEPDPGDRATCRVVVDELELEVDVEFQERGAIEVVAVAVAP